MKPTLIFVTVCLSVANVNGQVIPDYDLGGASRPKPDLSFRKEDQYKRVHQSSLRFILRDDLERTEQFLQSFLKDNPNDAESHYVLGILEGRRGNIETGLQHLREALEDGLPEDRLVAGPRELIEPFRGTALMRSLFQEYASRPVHGPLLGNVTGSAASFWVRTAEESELIVEVLATDRENDAAEASGQIIQSSSVRSSAVRDMTAVATVDGLQPETTYRYRIRIGGGDVVSDPKWAFHTFAPEGNSLTFRLAFGGGAGYVPANERMWNTIAETDPDAILLLGDNVYIDDPESVLMQQYTYQRRQSRPEWRSLTAGTPVYTIWDDHDFSTNDSWGGPDVDVPFWKRQWVWPIFRQNWANPAYGGGDEHPGCYYRFAIGDVDFIMLDCRYYRTDPKLPNPSMLGEVQLAWLKQQLKDLRGTFKVVCSSVPWDFRTKGDSLDTWNGYKQEHEEILSFIEDNSIDGVLLMSADRHRSDAWKIEREDGYGLYEFNSSRLTNQHVHPRMEKAGAIFSFNKPQSFGLVTFDTTAEDPWVKYEVVDINGNRPHEITVRRSELQ